MWTLLFDVAFWGLAGFLVIVGLIGLILRPVLNAIEDDNDAHPAPPVLVPCATCGEPATKYEYVTPQCRSCASKEWQRRERAESVLPYDN